MTSCTGIAEVMGLNPWIRLDNLLEQLTIENKALRISPDL